MSRALPERRLSRRAAALSWPLQIAVAAILGQTLFFKFSGAAESVHIFTTLGAEPWGRIASGVAELVAVVLLLVPRTAAVGALLSLGLISGAIVSHVTRLGIEIRLPGEVEGDGGLLFALALATFAASATVLGLRRREIPFIGPVIGARFDAPRPEDG